MQPCSSSKKKHFLCALFLGSFWVTVLSCTCEWQVPKRLHSKASSLKTRKASKGQEEILTCALQNGCSKIGKILGKSLCRSPVLETLSCNFIKKGSTADIFLINFRLFLAKQFHKNTSASLIKKGVHLFSKPNYYCFGRATVKV